MLRRLLCLACCFGIALSFSAAIRAEDKKGEILDNDKLILLIKEDGLLPDILDQITNSKCEFRHDTKAFIEIQKACKEAKWKPEDVSKLHKKVGELALQSQRDLKQLVFIFMGACENLPTVMDRDSDTQYDQQRKKMIIAGSAIVPYILDNLLIQESDRKRVGLLHALEGIGDKSAPILKQCILLLDDKSKPVRAQAASAVKALAGPETGDELIAQLDRREGVKDGVAMALGFMKYQKAADALVQLLKSSGDSDERVSAAFALGEMRSRTPAAQEALLMGILDDKDERLRSVCATACKRMGLLDTPSFVMKAYNRFRPGRKDLMQALDTIKNIDAARFLAEKLEDDDNEIRRVAMETLERLTKEKYEKRDEWNAFIELLALRPGWNGQRETTKKLPDVLD